MSSDGPSPRSSRGPREPAAQVKRLESQGAMLPRGHSVSQASRSPTRYTIDSPKSQIEGTQEANVKKSGQSSPSAPTSGSNSFEAMRATVAVERRREQRTPSTAPNPSVNTIRKAHYLKSKVSRVAPGSTTRACTYITVAHLSHFHF